MTDHTAAAGDRAPRPVDVLRHGTIALVGRMPFSSNATFLVEVAPPGCEPEDAGVDVVRAVYKPERGERPLWDFPPGLWRREVAASVIGDALGWDLVPPTICREDAPLDVGSLQLFIDADFSEHYFTLLEDEATHPQLMRMCAFDFVVNNTDRKGGHCLVDDDRHIWGIDNGLSFATELKLRTVIWDFGGEPVPGEMLADLARFLDDDLPSALTDLLDPLERDAVRVRARALLQSGTFPLDPTGHRYPWPLV